MKKYEDAYNTLLDTTVLQAICGRICPQKKQCEGSCIKGIKGQSVNIGALEAFIGDMSIENNWEINKVSEEGKNKKIAIIGGGPSGITAASYLARRGFNVTIYEKYDRLGGLLIHGIPEFRLSRNVIEKSIQKVLNLGIEVKYNSELGKNINLDDLEKEYDAILLAFGANVSTKMNIEGENLDGVYGGNELLENCNFPDFKDKNVCVIGGGNTAMDTSRTINKMGAKKVTVIYRRARKQMPAEDAEIEAAMKEGVEFLFQNNIIKIIGKDKVEKIECIKTELIKVDEDREKPVNIDGSNYELEMDYVIMAVGSKVQDGIIESQNLEKNDWGYIKIDKDRKTSRKKIFASGDVAGDKSTVAWASRAGRDAAEKIVEYLK